MKWRIHLLLFCRFRQKQPVVRCDESKHLITTPAPQFQLLLSSPLLLCCLFCWVIAPRPLLAVNPVLSGWETTRKLVKNTSLWIKPKGHSEMDKALTCHTGGMGRNPDTIEDFFNSEKIISSHILSGSPTRRALSLPMAWSNPGNRNLLKER